MKDVPKYALVTGALFAAITLAGGGAWYWTSGQLEEKIQERGQIEQKIKQVSGGGIFPSQPNLKAVEENLSAAEAVLAPLDPVMAKTSALFEPIRGKAEEGKPPPGLSPDAWKSLLTETRAELQRLANERKVKLPEEYYFGFKDYQLSQPPAAHTLQMGVQLLGIKEICSILFNAGIVELKTIKRVKVESAGAAALGGAPSEDTLPGAAVVSKDRLYRVYPFEVDFTCSPEVLEKATTSLASSPYFLLIRDMVVENPKISLARRSEVIGAAGNTAAGGNPAGGTGVPGSGASGLPKLLVVVSGTEDIQVRLRISLVEWDPPDLKFQPESQPAGGNAQATPNNRRKQP
jgi:hypothetical protein